MAAAIAAVALLLAVVAVMSPSTGPGEVAYTHRGEFAYTADAPAGLVYPTGEVTTGDPVFLALVDRVDLAFTYDLAGPDGGVEPSGQLWLEVTDGSGWSTRSSLGSAETGEDGTLQLEGTLDVPEVRRTLATVAEETGLDAGGGTLTVTAEIEVTGSIAGQPVADRFAPQLALQLTEQRLDVEGSSGDPDAADPNGAELSLESADSGAADGEDPEADGGIVRSEDGAVIVPGAEPARLELAGRGLEVGTARVAALVVLGLALLAVAVAAVAASRQQDLDEAAHIRARYGRKIVEVAALQIPAGYGVVDVREVTALVALADRTDRPVLHHRTRDSDTYLVEGDAAVYRYRVDGGDGGDGGDG
ncbi:MAG: DUF5305 family protein, partial [Nitriliruptor sp.]